MSEDSIKEKIRDLLLSNDFKRLTYKKDEANIFKIINMADKEIVHTDMLAWLFKNYVPVCACPSMPACTHATE